MKYLFILLLAVIGLSCTKTEKTVFEEYHSFSETDNNWERREEVKFTVPVEDTMKLYNQFIAVHFSGKFPFQKLIIKVTEISPSGKKINHIHELLYKNEERELLAQKEGETWILEQLVHEKREFKEAGEWKYIIKHQMFGDTAPYCKKLGFVLKEK